MISIVYLLGTTVEIGNVERCADDEGEEGESRVEEVETGR